MPRIRIPVPDFLGPNNASAVREISGYDAQHSDQCLTGDFTHPAMLSVYRQPHRREDVARAVARCRANEITVMLDLRLGGPGETLETAAETIAAIKAMEPDSVGAALGIGIYSGTRMEALLGAEGPLEANRGLRRHYSGPIDLLQPTFYIDILRKR